MQNLKCIIFSVVLLAFSLNLQAQSKPTPEQQANKVIGYTNTIIDLCNEAFKRMKEYPRTWEKSDDYIERVKKGKYDKRFPFSSVFYVNRIQAGYYATFEETAKKTSAFPEKDELGKLVANAKTSVQLLDSACKRLDRYLTKAQFEQDNKKYERYDILRDSAVTAWQNSRMAWRILANRTSEVGNNAELIIMKKNKGAPFIIPMKSDISALERVVDELYDLADFETLPADGVATLKTHVATLQASIAKNKNLQGKNTALLNNHEVDYTTFYDHAESCLQQLLILVDELVKTKPNNEAINNANKRMGDEYSATVKFYNFLIDIIGK